MIYTATPATFAAVIKRAGPGDTVQLGPGNYGAISLLKLVYAAPVTIKGAPDALIGSLNAVQCQGINFEGLAVRFSPAAATISSTPAVRLYQCQRMGIEACSILGGPAVSGVPQSAENLDSTGNVIGLPTGYGVRLQDCKDITFADNEMSGFFRGLVLAKVNGLKASGNKITGMRTSPITGGDVDNIEIEHNRLGSSTPWNYSGAGDHGDYVHLWTVAGRATSRGIVIRDNVLEQGAGQAMLGIYLDDNNLGIGFADVEIADNLIVNAERQAIRLERVTGRILRNTLVTPVEIADKRMLPTVIVTAGSAVELAQNILGKAPVVEQGGSFTGDGNVIVDRADYPKVFADGWKAVVAAGPTSLRTAIEAAKPSPLTPEQEQRVREIVREMGGL